jgi:proline utilization trans-activator
MLLTKIFDSACKPENRINPSPGLQDAMDMLQYLADRGNIFAREKFREVQGAWDHLSVTLQVHETSIRSTSRASRVWSTRI